MPADEKFHPMQIDFFCPQAIVKVPNVLANLIQKADRLQRRVAGFYGLNCSCINKQLCGLKPLLNKAFGSFFMVTLHCSAADKR
jgi:hypothetical protein